MSNQAHRKSESFLAHLKPTRAALLWHAVERRSGLKSAASGWRRALAGLAGAAALVLALLLPRAPDPFAEAESAGLADLTAAWHTEMLAPGYLPEFRSECDLEVEQYLRGRAGFPLRCPPRGHSGFAVAGAGMACTKLPAAYVVGRVGQAPVSVFVLGDGTDLRGTSSEVRYAAGIVCDPGPDPGVRPAASEVSGPCPGA